MSKESILSKLTVCPVCHRAYLASIDVCWCPESLHEEPKVSEWEDVAPNRAALAADLGGDTPCGCDAALLGQFQTGEITL